MRYSFEKAWKRFCANIRKYLFLMLQILVGVCMVALSLNINLSFQKESAAFARDVNNLYVNISAGTLYDNAPDTLSADDYTAMQEHFSAQKDAFAYYKKYDLFDSANETYIPVLFVDDNFYPLIMKAETVPEGRAYIGSSARQYLDDFALSQGKEPHDFWDAANSTVFGIPLSSLQPMENLRYHSKALLEDGFMSGVSGEVGFEDYLILPLFVYEGLASPPPAFVSRLAVSLPSNGDTALPKDVLHFLEQLHADKEVYDVANFYSMAIDNLNRNVHIAALLNFIAAFVLIIVVFGLIGLLFILVSQRNREFAIALMCGARHGQLAREVFLEIFCVVTLGVLAGNLACALFLPALSHGTIVPAYHIQTLLLTVSGGGAVCAFVCLLCLQRLKRVSPVAALKNE